MPFMRKGKVSVSAAREPAFRCRRHKRCSIPGLGKFPWIWKWQPTPMLLPGESQGQGNLVGYSPRGRKESDTMEGARTALLFLSPGLRERPIGKGNLGAGVYNTLLFLKTPLPVFPGLVNDLTTCLVPQIRNLGVVPDILPSLILTFG